MSQTTFSALENTPRLRSVRPVLAWIGGTLALFGGILFLQTLDVLSNWWADFILLAALALLAGGWAAYRLQDGWLRGLARLLIGFGLVTLTVALMFLLDLNWGDWWPLMLVVPGFALYLNGFSAPQDGRYGLAGYMQLAWWVGGAAMLLGLVFFLGNTGRLDLATLSKHFQWLGLVILIPALGAFYNAAWVFRQENERLTFASESLAVIGMAVSAVAVVTLLNLDWKVLTPLILIFTGFGLALSGWVAKQESGNH